MSHLLLDIIECESAILNHKDGLIYLLDCICNRYNLKILNKYEHEFEPCGLTIVYALYDSHVTIHTWPENKTVSIDLYCCKNMVKDMENIALEFKIRLKGKYKLKLIVDRISIE